MHPNIYEGGFELDGVRHDKVFEYWSCTGDVASKTMAGWLEFEKTGKVEAPLVRFEKNAKAFG